MLLARSPVSVLFAIIGLVASSAAALAQEAPETATPEVRISEFSQKPVPRFEALRYSEVNGRTGPSTAHPAIWKYQRAGLPVLIVKETVGWRQVRDPGGELVWIADSQLSSRPSAMVRGEEPVPLRRRADPTSPVLANLGVGLIVTLGECKNGWCRVEVDNRRGWVEKRTLWGADPFETGL